MKAFVYWNFHEKKFSIRVKGRVIAHATRLLIQDAEFRVSEAGRARVLAERQKNVHAGIHGEIVACDSTLCKRQSSSLLWPASANALARNVRAIGRVVRYNPYESGDFQIFGTGVAIQESGLVYCHANQFNGQAHLWAN